ncbi:MAG: GntP family permease [Bacteroidota bacterium]
MESIVALLAVIFFAIIFIIVATSVFKIHPFINLILACFIVGLSTGISPKEVVKIIGSGFGSILGYIGLIVALGAIIGVFLENSGALQRIANSLLSIFGKKRSVGAMAILGSLIGIPVFCDSGFIILSGLSKSIARRQGISTASTSLALASGLYTTHTLVPPTPGPIAAAGNIGATDHIGLIILIGLVTAIAVSIASITFIQRYGQKLSVEDESLENFDERASDEMGFVWAIIPIALPILLITVSSVFKVLQLEGEILNYIHFLGEPLVALMIGLFLSMAQIMPKIKLKDQSELIGKGLVQAGPILLITGAGGAFGAVLKATPLSDLLATEIESSTLSGVGFLVLVYAIAALLKTAQGSSTSALVITSSLLAPFVHIAGFSSGFDLALIVMALGAGAMTVSHSNDSYFWIVTKLSGFSLKTGYKGFTTLTLIQGVTALLVTIFLYVIAA